MHLPQFLSRSASIRVFLALAAAVVSACKPIPEPPTVEDPFPDRIRLDREAFAWTESTLRHLSVEQKVAQLFAIPAEGGFVSMDGPEVHACPGSGPRPSGRRRDLLSGYTAGSGRVCQ